jgi:hypothetical protein
VKEIWKVTKTSVRVHIMFESYWIILDLISVEKCIVPPLSGSGQSATLSRYWSSHLAPAHGSNHLKPKIPGPLMMILWSFIPKNPGIIGLNSLANHYQTME